LQRSLGNSGTEIGCSAALVLHRSLGNQGVILRQRGDLDKAMALHKEQEGLCRQLGDLAAVANSLGGQATILHRRGEPEKAMPLLDEALRLATQQGRAGLARKLRSLQEQVRAAAQ